VKYLPLLKIRKGSYMGYTHGINWNEDIIKSNILEAVKILNLNRMPTSREIRSLQISGLDGAISDTGGYIKWAEKLGLTNKKQIKYWTEKEIKLRILEIVEEVKY
jgi:anionic cell wall polymer biosynthesis LytR-Cps2A-Psr (LCP) family protein